MNHSDVLVSIVIPVYNVENHLRRCLDSVAEQTFQSVEVILIDDGSTDRSGSICDEYANTYANFKAFHQNNRGQANARNYGVRVSLGKFILFIDSDDFVERDYVEYLLFLQGKYDADIAIGGAKYLYDGETILNRKTETVELCMNTIDALKRMNYTKGYGSVPWAKLYKRELIVNHPFPEGQIYEDLAVLYRIVGDANSIVYGNRIVYYWVQREGSTMRSSFSSKQLIALEATKSQVQYMRQYFPEALASAKARHEAKIVELLSIVFSSRGDQKKLFNLIRKQSLFFQEVILDKNVKQSMKVRMIAIKVGYLAAKPIFFIHQQLKKLLID